MKTRSEVMTIIKEEIRELGLCTSTEIVEETHVIDDLSADSLDMLEMVIHLEETFNINIPDKDIEELLTIKQILDYLEKREILS